MLLTPTRNITRDITRGLTERGGVTPQITGSITTPIYTNEVVSMRFSEFIDPATVISVGNGSGSFELHDDTADAYVGDSNSTVDNLTFTFGLSTPLVAGHIYTIEPTSDIKGSVSGRSYSDPEADLTFTATQFVVSNADRFDYDCDDLDNWTDSDTGLGISSLDGGDHKFTDNGYNASNLALRDNNTNLWTTPTSKFSVSYLCHATKLGVEADNIVFFNPDIRFTSDGDLRFITKIFSDNIGVSGPGGYIYTPATVPINESFWLTFEITYNKGGATATCDVYLNNAKIITGANCYIAAAASNEGRIRNGYRDRVNEVTRGIFRIEKIKVGSATLGI